MSERPKLLPQFLKLLRNPLRLARLARPEVRRSAGRLLYRSLGYYFLRPRRRDWEETDTPGVRRRHYDSYDEYLKVQKGKLRLLNLSDYSVRFRNELGRRLTELASAGVDLRGLGVLCLAARTGAEVQAFRDQGAFAVGIDLEPGAENRFVLPGDFHALDFADGSVSLVYCNSLDHAFDLRRVAAEIRRVLAPDGHFLLEVMSGEAEGNEFGRWEASSWDSPDSVLAVFLASGFEAPAATLSFSVPWAGRAFLLPRSAKVGIAPAVPAESPGEGVQEGTRGS